MEKKSAKKKRLLAIIAALIIVIAAAIVLIVVLPKHHKNDQTPQNTATEDAGSSSAGQPEGESTETADAGKTAESEEKSKEDGKSQKEDADTKEDETSDKNTCKLTISNGAASANSSEAVNGLHVYNPDSEEMEDYFSGQELPIGKRVKIFVYNLATPVSLQIVHNGQVIASRSYPVREAFVNDDTVEYFDLVLAGDLVVSTSAISEADLKKAEEEQQQAQPENALPKKNSIRIIHGKLAKLFCDSKKISNGDKIADGTYNFKVVTDKKDVRVYFYKNGKLFRKKKVNAGMNQFTFKKVKVNSNIKIKLKDVTPEITEKSFKVVIVNNVKAKDGALTVGYVNDKEEVVNIKSGKKYDAKTVIGARALNYNGKRALRLTAYDKNGKKLDSVKVKTGTKKNPGANGFYLMLTGYTKYVLDYADASSDDKPAQEDPVTPSGDEETTTFKVSVTNGASAADTTEAVNGLHVYSKDDPDQEDIYGEVTLKKGTKMRIFAYPLASDIHLKIVHNGEVLADKDISKMQAWVDDDKIEFYDITLAGDLEVVTTVKQDVQPPEGQSPSGNNSSDAQNTPEVTGNAEGRSQQEPKQAEAKPEPAKEPQKQETPAIKEEQQKEPAPAPETTEETTAEAAEDAAPASEE